MAKRYVSIEATDIKKFVNKLNNAGRGDFQKELALFIEDIGEEFLRIVQDEIIRKQTVDTRLLLNSFQRSADGNMFVLKEGDLIIEVGTNVEYASYVNDGHWLNPKGVQTRFVPGHWTGDRFIYEPGANTGMLLKQKWIEGSHYWDYAIDAMEKMLPGLMEEKVQQWLQEYFSM